MGTPGRQKSAASRCTIAVGSQLSRWEPIMPDDSAELQEQLQRLAAGDQQALAELFACYRDRLRRMVQLRLDRRLQGRVDASDVLQEAYLDAAQRAAEYAAR